MTKGLLTYRQKKVLIKMSQGVAGYKAYMNEFGLTKESSQTALTKLLKRKESQDFLLKLEQDDSYEQIMTGREVVERIAKLATSAKTENTQLKALTALAEILNVKNGKKIAANFKTKGGKPDSSSQVASIDINWE